MAEALDLDVGWLDEDTNLNGLVEEGWLNLVSGIVRVLKDSTSLIAINQDLEQVLTKLIGMERKETQDRMMMDSIINAQKLIYKAQYRFTKLAETLYESSRNSLAALESENAEGCVVFCRFIECLNHETSATLRSAYKATVDASKSLRDLKNLLDSLKRHENGKLLEPIEGTSVVLVGIAGWGVGSFLGVSFVKSIISVVIGALSIVIILRMGKRKIVEVEVKTDDDTSLEDANFQAAVSLSYIEDQIKPLIDTQINRDDIFSETSVGHSLFELFELIEIISRRYLTLAESNYGPLTYRGEHNEDRASEEEDLIR